EHEDEGADQRTVQATRTPQHQDDQQVGGTQEAQGIQTHKLGGLRQQGTGDTSDTGTKRVHRNQAAIDVGTDSGHALAAFTDTDQAQAERRTRNAPNQNKDQEKHGEAIEEARLALQVEFKNAKKLPHLDAPQTIHATSDEGGLVGDFIKHQANAERDHESGEIMSTDHQETGKEPEQGRDNGTQKHAADRLAPSMHREQAGSIGAKTE